MTSSATTSSSGKAFICTGFALFVLIVGTNLPSPLYAVYAHRFGFSPFVLTLVFATYAGALVPALLLAGSLAEAWGYRRVLLPGLAAALASWRWYSDSPRWPSGGGPRLNQFRGADREAL